jgi:biopolymer transport protein ExbB
MSVFTENILARGGPVVWLLGVLGLAVVVIFMERLLYLHRGQIRSGEFVNGIKNLLAKGRLMEALTLCEETPGPVAVVAKTILRHAGADERALRHAVQDAAITELPRLERRINALAAIAQVAPLLGLLGALLGAGKTFWLFQQGGNYATAAVLSAGMWEALLAAAAGLVVAIPAHLGRHFLHGRVRALVHDMEWVANDLMDHVTRTANGGAEKK